MMSPLIALNDFEKAENGVFQKSSIAPFNYSDGENVERTLDNILREASDLSSGSVELEAAICDWPTEYHLSTSRANLLRPFDLSNCERVLELGCGCGSISRYLGEQSELQVDSVEGSNVRAQLAALRCRDLDNVCVSHGNFNDMTFPEQYYDLVLFVGVTEYAGRFSSRQTDQEALQDLLSLAKRALKPTGVAIIAIENRLGLKYLLGACEDHYGQPVVGVDNYPESSGIRTYSRGEWSTQIEQSEFSHWRFAFPFPDYKIPTLLIDQDACSDLPDTVLQGTVSRDYLRRFENSQHEALLWRGVIQSNTLDEYSNSFLILLGDDEARLKSMANFSIAEYDNKSFDWHAEPETHAVVKHKASEHVQRQQETIAELSRAVESLQQHAANLEEKLVIMRGSLGWRLMSRIRRFFGRSVEL